MKCPECKIRGMVQLSKGDTMLDLCPTCLGLWFDPGEMSLLRKEPFGEEGNRGSGYAESREKRAGYKSREDKNYECPLCKEALKAVDYQYTGNFVYHCGECNGTFAAMETARKIHMALESGEGKVKGRIRNEDDRDLKMGGAIGFSRISSFFPREKSTIPLPAIIPIGSDLKLGVFPAVTAGLVFIFVLFFLAGSVIFPSPAALLVKTGLAGGGTSALLPLVGYGFIHASAFPLLLNSCFTYFVGAPLEERLSPACYVALFMGGVIVAGLTHLAIKGGREPILGAAGGVSALLGAYAVTFPLVRVRMAFFGNIVSLPSYMMVIAWLFFMFLSSGDILLSFLNPNAPGFVPVSASFMAGAALAFLVKK